MGEQGFTRQAAEALDRLEADIERSAADADVDLELSRQDNVIDIEFEDGSKIIINSHEAAGEIWVAARSGGRAGSLGRRSQRPRVAADAGGMAVAPGRRGDRTGLTRAAALRRSAHRAPYPALQGNQKIWSRTLCDFGSVARPSSVTPSEPMPWPGPVSSK